MKTRNLLFILVVFLLISGMRGTGFSQWTASGTVLMPGTLWPSVSVASPNVIWICGGATTPFVFRSVNGGSSWTSIPTTGLPAKALMCIWALDSLTCYVGDGGDAGGTTGGDAAVSRTTNGGLNWTLMFNTGGTAGFFNGIVFSRSNPSFGVAESDLPTGAGNAFYLQITTNGGANWTLTNPPGVSGQASAQNTIVVIDNQFYGWGLNTNPLVRFTSNGGTSWNTGTLGITGTFTAGFAFSDNKLIGIGSTSTSFPNVARTTDGGTTWGSVNLGGAGTTALSCLKWVSGTNYVYFDGDITTGMAMYKSTDAGATWTVMTYPTGAINYTHFDFIKVGNTITGFAVSPNGTILKSVENITGISNEGSITPSEYKLNQNYPNPFNPSTTISFDLPRNEFVTLKVYDVVGKEIATIVNKQLTAGSYSELFEAPSNLTSGIYFYKLTAGSFSDTKKLVLVK